MISRLLWKLLCLSALLCLTGCADFVGSTKPPAVAPYDCKPCECDPFSAPDDPLPVDPIPDPSTDCPDGKCPLQATEKATAEKESGPGVRLAACQPCLRPANVSATDEVKTGTFNCGRCGRGVVGDEWHELRTPNGDSVLLMCKTCWDQSSPSERQAILARYLARNNLTGTELAVRLRSAL